LPDSGEEDVDAAVTAARRAFDDGPWSRTTAAERVRMLYRLAELVEQHADELAVIETMDNGKLLREVTPQIRALPQWYRYYAGAADKVYGQTLPTDNTDYMICTRREPVGVVAAIVGWNSALLQLTFKLAPALAVGCTLVAKPPEQASVSTLEFAKLVEAAGFPPGVFNVVTGTGERAQEPGSTSRHRQGGIHRIRRHRLAGDEGRR
jgi:acyl-CoA reductase-like NAD-dependent aldehyde dehydrogenase